MTEHKRSRCRSCNAEVIWTLNLANSKRMPVDAEPQIGGNVVLVSGNDGPESRTLSRDETERRAAQRIKAYVSHFATCPQSDRWRRS